MHYMVVRRMYFVDGWPVFSPEPFAGEGPETVTLAQWEQTLTQQEGPQTQPEQTQPQEHIDTWEWLAFLPNDNRIAISKNAPLPETLDKNHALVFSCYDFENSRETLAFSGITADGHSIWGKRSIST